MVAIGILLILLGVWWLANTWNNNLPGLIRGETSLKPQPLELQDVQTQQINLQNFVPFTYPGGNIESGTSSTKK
jgi:hypothetical protein